MINLLSAHELRQLHAARLNVILRRYMIFLGLLALFVVISIAFGYYSLMQEQKAANTVSAQYANNRAQYANDISQSKKFSQDLATAKTILNNEVLLSDVTLAIAQSLPPGSVIESLDLNTTALDSPLVLRILTKSYDEAVRTKDAFEKSDYFEKSVIINTSLLAEPSDGFTTGLSLQVNITAAKLARGN